MNVWLTESSKKCGKQVIEHEKLRWVLRGNEKGRLSEAYKTLDHFDEFTHNSKRYFEKYNAFV